MLQFATGKVTVGTSATKILNARSGRKEVRLRAPTGTVSIGPANTVIAGGWTIITDETPFQTEGEVWGIISSISRDVTYLEIYDDGT